LDLNPLEDLTHEFLFDEQVMFLAQLNLLPDLDEVLLSQHAVPLGHHLPLLLQHELELFVPQLHLRPQLLNLRAHNLRFINHIVDHVIAHVVVRHDLLYVLFLVRIFRCENVEVFNPLLFLFLFLQLRLNFGLPQIKNSVRLLSGLSPSLHNEFGVVMAAVVYNEVVH
jgi:hypothetical protein